MRSSEAGKMGVFSRSIRMVIVLIIAIAIAAVLYGTKEEPVKQERKKISSSG